MVASIGRGASLALALLAVTASASTARAQGNIFNPYGNSGYADYREFGSPKFGVSPSLPGQAIIGAEPIVTRPRANSFQQYADGLEGVSAEGAGSSPAARGSSAGLPYYRAYRQFDRDYDRIYRPNAIADKGFDDRIKQRDLAYARAQKETDPVKRARMLRQIELDSLDRPAPARPRAAAPGAQAKGAAPAPGRAPAPNATPSSRRVPAPSPYPATARPGTSAGSRPAPAPPPTAPGTRSRTNPPPPDPSTIPVPPPR